MYILSVVDLLILALLLSVLNSVLLLDLSNQWLVQKMKGGVKHDLKNIDMWDRKVIASVAKILISTWSVSLKVQHFQHLYCLFKKRFYNGILKICTITGRIVWKTTRRPLSIGLNYFAFYHIHLKMFLLNIMPPQNYTNHKQRALSKLSSQSRHKQVNKWKITNTQETLSCSLPLVPKNYFQYHGF